METTQATSQERIKPLSRRWADVLTWCEKRQIGQVYSYFRGSDPKLAEYEVRIRFVMRANPSVVVDTDEPWILSMEITIEAIRNRKVAA